MNPNKEYLIAMVYQDKEGNRLEKPRVGIFEIATDGEVTCDNCGCGIGTIEDHLEGHLTEVSD